jgi:hypothetical protein
MMVARCSGDRRFSNNEQRTTSNDQQITKPYPTWNSCTNYGFFSVPVKSTGSSRCCFFLVLLGALTVVTGGSALAPFIYSLF